jgi:hypothetical protein
MYLDPTYLMTVPVRSRLVIIALKCSKQNWLFKELRQGGEPKNFLYLETAIRAHDSWFA